MQSGRVNTSFSMKCVSFYLEVWVVTSFLLCILYFISRKPVILKVNMPWLAPYLHTYLHIFISSLTTNWHVGRLKYFDFKGSKLASWLFHKHNGGGGGEADFL